MLTSWLVGLIIDHTNQVPILKQKSENNDEVDEKRWYIKKV